MSKNRWGACLPIFLLMFVLAVSTSHAQMEIFLYDEDVASAIDLDTYLDTGDLKKSNGMGFFQWIMKGPAPDPYPQIAIPEKDFEYLGESNVELDGVVYVNHGRNLVKNKKAIVLWIVKIPNASQRYPSEFHQDMTLSLWVDWNQDGMWAESERMIQRNVNIYDQIPAEQDEFVVLFLTDFRVPDITDLMDASRANGRDKDLVHLWSRAVIAYDDPDMSPDGEQIFGEYEDYRLSYLVAPPGQQER